MTDGKDRSNWEKVVRNRKIENLEGNLESVMIFQEYWQNIYSVFVRDRGWIVLQEFLAIRVI